VLFEGCCSGCFSGREFMGIDIFPDLPVTCTATALCSLGMCLYHAIQWRLVFLDNLKHVGIFAVCSPCATRSKGSKGCGRELQTVRRPLPERFQKLPTVPRTYVNPYAAVKQFLRAPFFSYRHADEGWMASWMS
jgi:hypothetical protein